MKQICPLFSFLAVFLLSSCQDDSKEADAPKVESQEEKLAKPFLMPVEDIFSISGRDVTVTGNIEQGTIAVNDEVEIVGIRDTRTAKVTGIEMFRKTKESAEAGENVGLFLSGLAKEDLERGMVLSQPSAIAAHSKFEAEVKMLSVDDGGRNTPIFNGYRPQFYFRTTDVTGVTALPEGTGSVEPGGKVSMTVNLNSPIAMEEGQTFAVREGGRTVGTGVVTATIEIEKE